MLAPIPDVDIGGLGVGNVAPISMIAAPGSGQLRPLDNVGFPEFAAMSLVLGTSSSFTSCVAYPAWLIVSLAPRS